MIDIMGKDEDYKLRNLAEKIYNANWRQLPNKRYPPTWDAVSEEVRTFCVNQAREVLSEFRNNPDLYLD